MKSLFSKTLIAILLSTLAISVASANCSCTMKNAKGQTWVGTGPTKEKAAMNAQGFCEKHSKKLTNCVNVGCSCS